MTWEMADLPACGGYRRPAGASHIPHMPCTLIHHLATLLAEPNSRTQTWTAEAAFGVCETHRNVWQWFGIGLGLGQTVHFRTQRQAVKMLEDIGVDVEKELLIQVLESFYCCCIMG